MATVVAPLTGRFVERGLWKSDWTFISSGPGAVESIAGLDYKTVQVNGLPTTGTAVVFEGSNVAPTGPFSNCGAVTGGSINITNDGLVVISGSIQHIRPVASDVSSGTQLDVRMLSVEPVKPLAVSSGGGESGPDLGFIPHDDLLTHWFSLNWYGIEGGLAANDPVAKIKILTVGTYDFYVKNLILRRTTDNATLTSLQGGNDAVLEILYDHTKTVGGDIDVSSQADNTKPRIIANAAWGNGTYNLLGFDGSSYRIETPRTQAVLTSDHDFFLLANCDATVGLRYFISSWGPNFMTSIGVSSGVWRAVAGATAATGSAADTNEHVFVHHQENAASNDGLYIDGVRDIAVTTTQTSAAKYSVGDREPIAASELDCNILDFGWSPAMTVAQMQEVRTWLNDSYLTA